jgi:HSP20 family protein
MSMNQSLSTRNKNPANLLQNEMSNLFRRFNRDLETFDSDLSSFSPRVEVKDKDKSYVIKAEVPGMKENDINVTLRDNNLILEGERKSENEEEKEGVYTSEFSYGSFFRTIPLDEEVNPDSVKASCKNGILKIELEKVRPSTHNSKKIPILNS